MNSILVLLSLFLPMLLFSDEALYEYRSSISPITMDHFQEMRFSWKDNNPVPLENLRIVTVVHLGFDGKIHEGCLVVHEKVAEEITEIFRELFLGNFPIEKMSFVDLYEGDDEWSASDNNSYAFASRSITGMMGVFSKHSYGLAVDINPLYNPYARGDLIVPSNGAIYLDRSIKTQGTIDKDSLCYQAFVKRGWIWGGSWKESRGYVDYHHFEKDPNEVLKPN